MVSETFDEKMLKAFASIASKDGSESIIAWHRLVAAGFAEAIPNDHGCEFELSARGQTAQRYYAMRGKN